MAVEQCPTLERVYYEVRLYGADVYYGFAQYCFWRAVVHSTHPDWMAVVPRYFVTAGTPAPQEAP